MLTGSPKAALFLALPGPLYNENLLSMADVAKRSGYQTILVTPHMARLPGGGVIDHHISCGSPEEAPEIVRALRARELDGSIAQIFPLQERFVESAARLRSPPCFNCSGLQPAQARLFRDKNAMHERADALGIETPHSSTAISLSDLLAFGQEVAYPFILKPRDGSGCSGVTAVQSPAHLRKLLMRINGSHAHYRAEAFIDAPQYHVETLIRGGQILFSALFRYTYAPIDFRETPGGTISRSNPTPEEAQILSTNERLVTNFFGKETGVAHAEYFFAKTTAGVPRVILGEVGARFGGGPIVPLLNELYGLHLPTALAEIAFNPHFTFQAPRPRYPGFELGAEFLMTHNHGRIERIASSDELQLTNPGLLSAQIFAHRGERVNPPSKSTKDMMGFTIARGRSDQEIRRTFASIRRTFANHLRLESAQDAMHL